MNRLLTVLAAATARWSPGDFTGVSHTPLADAFFVQAAPGAVDWDERNDRGAEVAAGVYLYRVQAGSEVRIGKLAPIK
jgi:hypothetical protein